MSYYGDQYIPNAFTLTCHGLAVAGNITDFDLTFDVIRRQRSIKYISHAVTIVVNVTDAAISTSAVPAPYRGLDQDHLRSFIGKTAGNVPQMFAMLFTGSVGYPGTEYFIQIRTAGDTLITNETYVLKSAEFEVPAPAL